MPSACINLIRETPFQSWSLEDAHWGRFCGEVAWWKHFLQLWVPREIGWRLHPCYNKKGVFFWEKHFQIVLIVTGNEQYLELESCSGRIGVLKHPLAQRLWVLWVSCALWKQTDHRKPQAWLPTHSVKGCDITGAWCSVRVDSKFVFGAMEAPLRAHLHLVSLLASTCSGCILWKAGSSFGTRVDCGVFSSLKPMVSSAEKLSVRPASFYSSLVLEQHNCWWLLDLFTGQLHEGPGEKLAVGSTWIAFLLHKFSPSCLLC